MCWHRRYELGDQHEFRTPGEFRGWVRKVDVAVALPLYLYDHGGLTMSTKGWLYPYNDPWDAGQVGWIYVTKTRLRKEFGIRRVTKKILRRAEEILRAEVEVYDQYLRGEVYGFTAYNVVGGEIEVLDSCGGFYGDDPAKNGMLECVPGELRQPLRAVGHLYDGLIVTEEGEEMSAGPGVLERLVTSGCIPACVAEKCSLLRELAG